MHYNVFLYVGVSSWEKSWEKLNCMLDVSLCLTVIVLKSRKARSVEVNKLCECDHCCFSFLFDFSVNLLQDLLQQNELHDTMCVCVCVCVCVRTHFTFCRIFYSTFNLCEMFYIKMCWLIKTLLHFNKIFNYTTCPFL